MNRLESTILKNLIYNEEFTRKVLPFIKQDYFADNTEKIVFKEIFEFIQEFKNPPTHEALVINFTEKKDLTETQVSDSIELLREIHNQRNEPTDTEWLIKETEKFCQDKAIYNAIMDSVSILDNKQQNKTKGEIPKLLSDALGVSFDSHVGHDYTEDSDRRYDSYHQVESRIKFDLDLFNKITKGGLPIKTLNIALAGTGVGKSLFMCHHAASCLSQGHNVLYITLEMAEERIAQRIDANLMNITMDELEKIPKDAYDKKMGRIRNMVKGKLIVKEYPTASANVNHFRNLMNELKLKRRFTPDIIFVDYINIATSSRLKFGNSVNSYNY